MLPIIANGIGGQVPEARATRCAYPTGEVPGRVFATRPINLSKTRIGRADARHDDPDGQNNMTSDSFPHDHDRAGRDAGQPGGLRPAEPAADDSAATLNPRRRYSPRGAAAAFVARSGPRARELPERRRRAGAAAAVGRQARLGLHELRDADRVARQRAGPLVAAAARPLPALRRARSRGATRRSSSPRRCSSPRCLARLRPHRVRRARCRSSAPSSSRLGDRPRAPDHPEPDRRSPRPRVVLVAQTLLDPSPEWAARRRSAASGFLLVAALVYPAGMGMGDVKLALLLGAMLGRDRPGRADARDARSRSCRASSCWRGTARAARKMGIPFGPFLALGGDRALFSGEPARRYLSLL